MRRVVSLFLPIWPTDRLRPQKGHEAPALNEPLVIAGHDGRRRVVIAADHVAQALGYSWACRSSWRRHASPACMSRRTIRLLSVCFGLPQVHKA
jgi:hypothetical protein